MIGRWNATVAFAFIAALLGAALASAHYKRRIERLHAERNVAQSKIAAIQTQLAHAQAVTRIEVRYRDRIKVVKEKGDAIIQKVPVYVTAQDNARFGVHTGFVRSINAAFSGQSAGPAAESDREPARVSLAEIAKTTAFNAAVCRQWREQALGWRAFYQALQTQSALD